MTFTQNVAIVKAVVAVVSLISFQDFSPESWAVCGLSKVNEKSFQRISKLMVGQSVKFLCSSRTGFTPTMTPEIKAAGSFGKRYPSTCK